MAATLARAEQLAAMIAAWAEGAGVDAPRVVTRPADVIMPCLLIGPPDLDFSTMACTWRIVALAAPGGDPWGDLEHLLTLTSDALPVLTATAGMLTVPGTDQPVPTYTMTIEETLT